MKENDEKIRGRILSLIDSEFESDAAFERALGLKDKTVNNWRRGRSSSFMKILPQLAEHFKVNITDLLDIPLSGDSTELSDEEMHLLMMYRKSRLMPQRLRSALKDSLESVISLYLMAYNETKSKGKAHPKSKSVTQSNISADGTAKKDGVQKTRPTKQNSR